MKTSKPIQAARGIALPMAMIVMVILTSLMIAFAVLATSESQSASNQMASAQARALAESGVERALWAMTTGESNPGASGVLLLDAGYNLVEISVVAVSLKKKNDDRKLSVERALPPPPRPPGAPPRAPPSATARSLGRGL